MRLVITGHRDEKLSNYDSNWIRTSIWSLVGKTMSHHGVTLAYSGMASGVDLAFCQACQSRNLPYIACIPFEEQAATMSDASKEWRARCISAAASVMHVKNSWMVEHAEIAIVVWDGNKGGTHNVLQQLIEKKIPFYWVNPVSQKV